jgi:hypothetical protein
MVRYVRVMNKNASNPPQDRDPLEVLRADLARGDQALAGVAPVLVHLLAQSGQTMVSDETLAQLRGMIDHLAEQLITSLLGQNDIDPALSVVKADLIRHLSGSTHLLSHCYAVAVEGQLTRRFEGELNLDQVLSPLLQELIASKDEATAELAMLLLSAQARFVQSQARMSLPLAELPADLFRHVISVASNIVTDDAGIDQDVASASLREKFDEADSRLALLARLVTTLGGGKSAALNLEHAGFAMFASALASNSGQPRELAVLACSEKQHTRFAFTMKAAGMQPEDVERAMSIVHSQVDLPETFADLSAQGAAAMLGKSPTNTPGSGR